jgi:hypothetical protein
MTETPTTVLLRVEDRILSVRGSQVLLDSDLAATYGVTTAALNQAVKRNEARFPADFRFQLSPEEAESLKSQSVTSNSRRGGRRKSPWVFTEHGAIMAATVLNSPRAVEMSVFVVRAFVHLRDFARTHAELSRQLATLERQVVSPMSPENERSTTSWSSSAATSVTPVPGVTVGGLTDAPSRAPE